MTSGCSLIAVQLQPGLRDALREEGAVGVDGWEAGGAAVPGGGAEGGLEDQPAAGGEQPGQAGHRPAAAQHGQAGVQQDCHLNPGLSGTAYSRQRWE